MQRSDNAAGAGMSVEPLCAALGGDIGGVDLARVDDDAFAAIHAAFLRCLVLRFRRQRITPSELVDFSRRFGTLDEAPANENGQRHVEAQPEILIISNVVENGREIGSLGSGEAVWHTDMSYLPEPPMASVLHAREVPASGGDTSFMDMYAALEGLPAELRALADRFSIKHDATTNSAGYLRVDAEPEVDVTRSAGQAHPMVRVHPQTGRKALYLGRRHRAWVTGLSLPDSEALLDALWAYAVQPRYRFTQRWQVGDVLMWDNRCTMHRRDAFDADARRIMYRTQIRAG